MRSLNEQALVPAFAALVAGVAFGVLLGLTWYERLAPLLLTPGYYGARP